MDTLGQQIYKSMDLKDTPELLEIWKANDRNEWSDQTFDVIKEILLERNVELPEPLDDKDKEIAASSAVTAVEEQKYQKIGGWLILVGIGIILNSIRLLFPISELISIFFNGSWSILTTPGTIAYHPMWAISIIFELLVNIALLVFSIVVAIFFFQKSRAVPSMIIAYLLFNLVFVVLDFFLATSIPAIASEANQRALAEIGRSALVCAIWIPYFQNAKRVKGTFVH